MYIFKICSMSCHKLFNFTRFKFECYGKINPLFPKRKSMKSFCVCHTNQNNKQSYKTFFCMNEND